MGGGAGEAWQGAGGCGRGTIDRALIHHAVVDRSAKHMIDLVQWHLDSFFVLELMRLMANLTPSLFSN